LERKTVVTSSRLPERVAPSLLIDNHGIFGLMQGQNFELDDQNISAHEDKTLASAGPALKEPIFACFCTRLLGSG
jgi:hypothetical protein